MEGPRRARYLPFGLLLACALSAAVACRGPIPVATSVDAVATSSEPDAPASGSEVDGLPAQPWQPGMQPMALVVEVLASYPHDPTAFTQGLIDHEGDLYESTGLNGRSSLRRVDLETGRVEQRVELDEQYFAEGLERVGDRLIQLTWQSGKAFVYDLDSFERLGEHDYATEGWGLCLDEGSGRLVMSDGSDHLFFRDPERFEELGRIRVTRAGAPQDMLNELECVGGRVYANIWQTDQIAIIDPGTGAIGALIDTAAPGSDPLLAPEEAAAADVLNGIVWMEDREAFLITGKFWPRLFEVEFHPESSR